MNAAIKKAQDAIKDLDALGEKTDRNADRAAAKSMDRIFLEAAFCKAMCIIRDIAAMDGLDTGLFDRRGQSIRIGNVVHWTDGGDELDLEKRIATRWDRIAVVSVEGILPKFTVIDSPNAETKQHGNKFNYGNFIYKETEKYLTVVAASQGEYQSKFMNAGECMAWVLKHAGNKE